MAGWNRQANRDRDALERIVALLVALAGLADLACGLPALRRRRLLGILGCGEAEARAFVVGLMPAPPTQFNEPELAGDAARLAASFRALALVLYAMLERRFAFSGAIGPRIGGAKPVGPAARATVPAPDTS